MWGKRKIWGKSYGNGKSYGILCKSYGIMEDLRMKNGKSRKSGIPVWSMVSGHGTCGTSLGLAVCHGLFAKKWLGDFGQGQMLGFIFQHHGFAYGKYPIKSLGWIHSPHPSGTFASSSADGLAIPDLLGDLSDHFFRRAGTRWTLPKGRCL
jgi:hypothetical protein